MNEAEMPPDVEKNEVVEERRIITRRDFLRGLLMASASSVLVACGVEEEEEGQLLAQQGRTATPARYLASPQAPAGEAAPGEATGTPTSPPEDGGLSLEAFLALSAVLTGVENLDPVLGRVYLDNLQASDGFDVTLNELYEQAGFGGEQGPADIEALEQANLFDAEATRKLADTIIEYWYSGVYTTPEGEPKVATYVDALAWKVLTFTKPNSICASPGFWEKHPEVSIPRD